MTHTDFNHLLTSIKALTPEQVRQLRQQLDRQLAEPKKRPAPASGKAAKRAKAPSLEKKPLTRDEFNQRLMAAGLITRLPDPSLDIDDDSGRSAGHHQGRAAVGNHHPRAARGGGGILPVKLAAALDINQKEQDRVPPRLLLKYPLRTKVSGPGRGPVRTGRTV